MSVNLPPVPGENQTHPHRNATSETKQSQENEFLRKQMEELKAINAQLSQELAEAKELISQFSRVRTDDDAMYQLFEES